VSANHPRWRRTFAGTSGSRPPVEYWPFASLLPAQSAGRPSKLSKPCTRLDVRPAITQMDLPPKTPNSRKRPEQVTRSTAERSSGSLSMK
jgi:hypothetical protein